MRKPSLFLLVVCLTAGLLTSCADERSDLTSPTDATVARNLEPLPADKSDGNIEYSYNPVISGTSHVGIILAEFDDTPTTKSFQANPGYAQEVMDAVVGPNASMDQLYEQMTGHLADPVRFTAEVVDQVVLDGALNTACSNLSRQTWRDAAKAAATDGGADLTEFDVVMVVMSTDNTCAANNFRVSQAYFSPPTVIITTWDLPPDNHSNDFSHEVGHLLGFGHSNSPQYDYWDYSCLMGENTEYDGNGSPVAWVPNRQLNVIWKIAAGYIDPATEMQTIEGGGHYTAYLAPSEYHPDEVVDPTFGTAYRALRVNASNEIYYVSYRQSRAPFLIDPHGTHAWEVVQNRVHVHRYDSAYPGAAEIVAVLEAGDSFAVDDVVITAITDGLDGDVDYVAVSIELDDCLAGFDAVVDETTVYRNAAPRFPISAAFPIEATNLSDASCGDESFSYQLEVVSGTYQAQPSSFLSVDVAGGDTETAAVNMIYFSDPGDGIFEGLIRCGPTGDETTTIPVTWVLDRVAPTVPGGLAANLFDCTAALTWGGSYDQTAGVSHYEIHRNGQYLDQTTDTSYADVLANPANGASYSYQVKAVDLAGNASALSGAAMIDLPEIVISNIFVARTNAVDCTITVTFDTNIPTTAMVVYGNACNNQPYAAYGSGTATSHTVVCDVFELSAFAFFIRATDGCVTADSACQQKARGKCIAIQ